MHTRAAHSVFPDRNAGPLKKKSDYTMDCGRWRAASFVSAECSDGRSSRSSSWPCAIGRFMVLVGAFDEVAALGVADPASPQYSLAMAAIANRLLRVQQESNERLVCHISPNSPPILRRSNMSTKEVHRLISQSAAIAPLLRSVKGTSEMALLSHNAVRRRVGGEGGFELCVSPRPLPSIDSSFVPESTVAASLDVQLSAASYGIVATVTVTEVVTFPRDSMSAVHLTPICGDAFASRSASNEAWAVQCASSSGSVLLPLDVRAEAPPELVNSITHEQEVLNSCGPSSVLLCRLSRFEVEGGPLSSSEGSSSDSRCRKPVSSGAVSRWDGASTNDQSSSSSAAPSGVASATLRVPAHEQSQHQNASDVAGLCAFRVVRQYEMNILNDGQMLTLALPLLPSPVSPHEPTAAPPTTSICLRVSLLDPAAGGVADVTCPTHDLRRTSEDAAGAATFTTLPRTDSACTTSGGPRAAGSADQQQQQSSFPGLFLAMIEPRNPLFRWNAVRGHVTLHRAALASAQKNTGAGAGACDEACGCGAVVSNGGDITPLPPGLATLTAACLASAADAVTLDAGGRGRCGSCGTDGHDDDDTRRIPRANSSWFSRGEKCPSSRRHCVVEHGSTGDDSCGSGEGGRSRSSGTSSRSSSGSDPDLPAPSAIENDAATATATAAAEGTAECTPAAADAAAAASAASACAAAATAPATPAPPSSSPANSGGGGVGPIVIPRHVAIVMDGNGRWAQGRGLPRSAGHRAGVDAIHRIIRAARRLHVEVLTLFAFSAQNWSRPHEEVKLLMGLLAHFVATDCEELVANGVRLLVNGDTAKLPLVARLGLERLVAVSAGNSGLTLCLALSYGGREEIATAAAAAAAAVASGRLSAAALSEPSVFRSFLPHPWLPDPDLLIRTSGEMRVSNFLLWHIAYAELHVTPVLWPDFSEAHLLAAVADYGRRERRFGKTSAQVQLSGAGDDAEVEVGGDGGKGGAGAVATPPIDAEGTAAAAAASYSSSGDGVDDVALRHASAGNILNSTGSEYYYSALSMAPALAASYFSLRLPAAPTALILTVLLTASAMLLVVWAPFVHYYSSPTLASSAAFFDASTHCCSCIDSAPAAAAAAPFLFNGLPPVPLRSSRNTIHDGWSSSSRAAGDDGGASALGGSALVYDSAGTAVAAAGGTASVERGVADAALACAGRPCALDNGSTAHSHVSDSIASLCGGSIAAADVASHHVLCSRTTPPATAAAAAATPPADAATTAAPVVEACAAAAAAASAPSSSGSSSGSARSDDCSAAVTGACHAHTAVVTPSSSSGTTSTSSSGTVSSTSSSGITSSSRGSVHWASASQTGGSCGSSGSGGGGGSGSISNFGEASVTPSLGGGVGAR